MAWHGISLQKDKGKRTPSTTHQSPSHLKPPSPCPKSKTGTFKSHASSGPATLPTTHLTCARVLSLMPHACTNAI